jgi:hypothetical protein
MDGRRRTGAVTSVGPRVPCAAPSIGHDAGAREPTAANAMAARRLVDNVGGFGHDAAT